MKTSPAVAPQSPPRKVDEKKIHVLLADDHRSVVEGFKLLLEMEPDICVVGEAKTGDEAVRLNSTLHPDIILMDISMPGLNGLHAANKILRDDPKAKIIILSMSPNEEFVRHSLEIGARGYLLKENASTEIIMAVREVAVNNNPYYCPAVQNTVIEYSKDKTSSPPKKSLTTREWEVLQMVAEEKTNEEIARALLIATKTVEKHKKAIKAKLGVQTSAGIIKFALRSGMIPP